jgi:hypothetical protein
MEPVVMRWKKYDTPSPKMKNHTATAFGNSILFFGGFDGTTNSGRLRWLDPKTQEWSTVEPSVEMDNSVRPKGRNGHSATLVGDELFCIGGWLGVG